MREAGEKNQKQHEGNDRAQEDIGKKGVFPQGAMAQRGKAERWLQSKGAEEGA